MDWTWLFDPARQYEPTITGLAEDMLKRGATMGDLHTPITGHVVIVLRRHSEILGIVSNEDAPDGVVFVATAPIPQEYR